MTGWVNTPGYPVIHVSRLRSGQLSISQRRFLIDLTSRDRYAPAVSPAGFVCIVLNYTGALQPVATCRQSPYLHHMASFSLWRHSRVSRLRRSQPPFSLWHHAHYDVIRYWAGHAQRYGRTLRTDTLPRLMYKDFKVPKHNLSYRVVN